MNRLWAWLSRAASTVGAWLLPLYRTVFVEDMLPDRLRRRTLYVVREDDYLEQAALLCPCGCKSVLQMNLLADSRPCGQFTEHPDGTATLQPSVWRKKDCKSHFWFRQGRVQWCRDFSRLSSDIGE